jgi:hypothetical protein
MVASIKNENEQKFTIEFDQLRRSEYIRIETLAEIPIDKNLDSIDVEEELLFNLQINHRISDTRKIKMIDLPIENRFSRF